ncbi:MAG: LuxR family transcriptional regulator [Actinobacteria bacterium]|nr:MAG: LuxR family transcriptional regulator [Actinomycetota bacterium]
MLVGRDAECLRITGALDQVRAGRGSTLLLTGPPGVGKTALLAYAADAAGDLPVLRATGVEFESRFAWGGLHQLLQPVLDQLDAVPAEQAAALRGALRLGPATGDDPFLVFLAVLSVLSQITGGVVCLVDDAQWLDDQSADALRFVARRLARDPIGLLVAARDQNPRDQPASRFARDPWPKLAVPGLPPAGMAELIDRQADGTVAREVRERLLRYADGNPLALLEIVANLSADELAGRRPLPDPLPLSAGVEAAFLDQVRRLPVAAQELLLVAACADGTSWAQILDAAQLLDLPGPAATGIEATGLVTIGPDGARFRHPLVRSAVVSAAPFTQRRAVHLALAATLAGDGHADRRTWHLAAAALGPDAEVADRLEATAERARVRSGYAAAAAALERAAELSPGAADRARRLVAAAGAAARAGQPGRALAAAVRAERDAGGDPPLLGRIAALRGQIQLRAGLISEAVGTLTAGAELVADTDPRAALEMLFGATEAAGYAGDMPVVLDLAARARRLNTTDARARLLRDWLTGIADVISGEVERGAAVLRAAADHPARPDLPRWLMWEAYGAMYLGDVDRMIRLFEAAARRARAEGALDDLPLALHGVSVAETIRGHYPDAAAVADEGLRLARETGQDSAECLNLAALAVVAALRGDERRCREYADGALAQGIPRRFGLAVGRTQWALAVLDLGAGRPDAALPRLRAVAEATPGAGHVLIALYATPDLVEAAVRCGDTESALRATAMLELVVANSPDPSSGAWLARCQGLLAEPVPAVKHFREALRLYDLGQERFERARTELLLGAALRRARRRTEARETLRSALAALDALDARDWAEQARRELRALGDAPADAQRAGLATLTPQELQIARLVSGGASNREIAAQLFLSPRTVEYHLYKLYPKLGIGSRTELARVVLTDGRP